MSSRLDLAEHVEHFRERVLQDALADATAAYWRRRAGMYRWAAPRPGDFTGRATAAELEERRRRCEQLAEQCDHRASLSLDREGWPHDAR
jgi:hypothetical protein